MAQHTQERKPLGLFQFYSKVYSISKDKGTISIKFWGNEHPEILESDKLCKWYDN